MGSISRFSAIERFVDAFGERISSNYQYLVGAIITEMSGKEVSYHVKADVTLVKEGEFEESFEVHHRWATQEEDSEGQEIFESEEDAYPMEAYFKDYCKGKVVSKVYVGNSDRDDEVYLFVEADDEGYLEIPVGFNSATGDISGIAEELLSEEELNDFFQRN